MPVTISRSRRWSHQSEDIKFTMIYKKEVSKLHLGKTEKQNCLKINVTFQTDNTNYSFFVVVEWQNSPLIVKVKFFVI